nr:hypothetical protein [Nakamurella flavida]
MVAAWIVNRPWYVRQDAAPELARAGGFRLDDPAGEVGIEFMHVVDTAGADPVVYHVPVTYRGAPPTGDDGSPTDGALIGRAEHGVLGTRWVYDGEHDPVLLSALAAFCNGAVQAQAQSETDTLDPSVRVEGVSGTVSVADLRIVHRLAAGPVPDGGGVSGTWTTPDGERLRGPLVVLR